MSRPSRFKPGDVFTRLTAIEQTGPNYALYLCACGTRKGIYISHVLAGKTKSCGCLRNEKASERAKAQGTHNKYGTAIYGVWRSMLDRCLNMASHAWADYGGRGITVCERWRTFQNFYADMGEPPKGTTLERRKNSLGYSLENCYWATRKEQANNRRNNRLLTYKGKTQSASLWADELGLDRMRIYDRLRLGWSDERTLTQPKRGL